MGSGSAFAGRAAELELLAGQAGAASRGEGRVVLIGGEPGIGKTRLAGEAAARAAAAGMRCVRARAQPGRGVPAVRDVPAGALGTHRNIEPNEYQRADLAVIAMDVPAGAVPAEPTAGRRFQVFETVREYLTAAAAGTGLLLLFDDVHWADPPTLRLLRHLAAGAGTARMLLLVTYRDTETGGRDELTAFLAALAREDAVTRIRLTGLSQDEVAAQLAAVTGAEVAPELAAAIGRRTHGNPFFVAELGRLHGVENRPGALPEAVRDTLRVRLHSLTPGGRDVLCAAAVLGAAVDPVAVAAVTGREVAAVLAVLDEAAAAGLVAGGDGWSFGHDLIRETAWFELPTADRLAAHARMADYLRRRPDAEAAVVAHHLLESLPVGDAALAAAARA